jgi:peptidoglycan hydrolase CwlO-like protein
MKRFNFGKKRTVLDLSEKYRKQQEKISSTQEETKEVQEINSSESPLGGGFSLFGNTSNSNETKPDYSANDDVDSKRKRLAKRLIDMTSKIEELSNQIYHLQQRIEVLEKKSGL